MVSHLVRFHPTHEWCGISRSRVNPKTANVVETALCHPGFPLTCTGRRLSTHTIHPRKFCGSQTPHPICPSNVNWRHNHKFHPHAPGYPLYPTCVAPHSAHGEPRAGLSFSPQSTRLALLCPSHHTRQHLVWLPSGLVSCSGKTGWLQ